MVIAVRKMIAIANLVMWNSIEKKSYIFKGIVISAWGCIGTGKLCDCGILCESCVMRSKAITAKAAKKGREGRKEPLHAH